MASQLDVHLYPVMKGDREAMYNALVNHDSYYELSLEVRKHADLLVKQNQFRGTNTANDLIKRDKVNQRRLALLLHSIPRKLLESVIKGSIAYDFLSPGPVPDHYTRNGAGTYVAGIAIDGRSGDFLCIEEIEELIDALENYNKAYVKQKEHNGNPTTTQDRVLHAWALNVDKTYAKRTPKDRKILRFVINDNQQKATKNLIESLRQRCKPGDLASPSILRHRYQRQSPLMVGCSNDLNERMPHHLPESGLDSTTHTWALTLTMIKSCLKLDPIPVVQPLIHIWERNDLPASEVLGSALASSYCFQDGFNIIAGGSQRFKKYSNDPKLRESRDEIFQNPFFTQNINASISELQRREQYHSNLLDIATVYHPDTFTRVLQVQMLAKDTRLEIEYYLKAKSEAETEKKRLEDVFQQTYREIDTLENVKRIYELLERLEE